MIIHPVSIGRFFTAHAHINLLGWVSMMIFAVAYHVLPRFSGKPLYSDKLADLHFITANAGLLGLIIAWPLLKTFRSLPLRIIHILSALLFAVGAYMFVYNIWKTVFSKSS